MNATDPVATSLGILIRHAAEDQGITLVELSERSGVPRGSLYRYIDGDRDMKISTIEAIATALGMDAGVLLHDAIQHARRNAQTA